MTPQEHYAEAERLLAEGAEVVEKIRLVPLAEIDGRYPAADRYAAIQRRRDELGKKAMGIWAQAQVHATLAAIPFQQVSVEVANLGDLR